MTEDLKIGKYDIKAGQQLWANIHQLHHCDEQWGPEHNEFIPERFDPSSNFSLKEKERRNGVSRNPHSYLPFLGGKRVCLGKTFADTTFKAVLPLLLKAFNKNGRLGEFVEQAHYREKPQNNAVLLVRPEINIRLHKSSPQ